MEIYESVSLGQILERGAAQAPDKIAVVDGNKRKTYRELNDLVNALAASLAETGVKKGDPIAIHMPNSLEMMTTFYALQKLSAIVA